MLTDEISELMDAENDESLAKMRYSVGGRHSNGYIKVFECVLKKYHWLKNVGKQTDFIVSCFAHTILYLLASTGF